MAEPQLSAALAARSERIRAAFAEVGPAIERVATGGYSSDAEARAALSAVGDVSALGPLAGDWKRPVDWVARQAELVIGVFARLVAEAGERSSMLDGEPAEVVMRRFGFHAVDITTCADGRMAGLLDHVLRVPRSIVAERRSYAGALFPVAEAVSAWERSELRRLRNGVGASPGARFLKMGVYHFSSRDPSHEGCAAHGSDDRKAAGMLLDRLEAFATAISRRYGDGGMVAILLAGHDTDTDSLRVHVPDASGRMAIDRFVCARYLHDATAGMGREEAKEHIRQEVAACMGVAADDPATEGMRWFCGYLLKNNVAQVAAVRALYGEGYPDAGHDERLIVFGDPMDDVQLRNLAFQAQGQSVEERAGDLAVGVRILGQRLAAEGLAVPVLVVRGFDPDVPGDEQDAEAAALRMRAAVERMFPPGNGPRVHPVAAVRPTTGGALRFVRESSASGAGRGPCGCGGHRA
ncbi:MAG: carboxysome shell carbonic anhydrase [Acetobacteraceae bacterium]|nr:carboxysome shell carbonic anhydrase [Acetobacteraceae bacterium]